MWVVEHDPTLKEPPVSRLSFRFRSFYFSNNWEMLNTEQIKMPPVKTPENRFSSTSCSTFPLLPAVLLCSFLIVCSFTLASTNVYKKSTETMHIPASYWSLGFEFSHVNPGLVDRRVQCGSKSRLTIYQGTLVGMSDWKNEQRGRTKIQS